MARQDYIIRAIKATLRALLRAREQREAGEVVSAFDTLDKACESLVGLVPSAVLGMPVASLMDLLGSPDIDAARALALAEIIKEIGHVAEACDDGPKRAQACYQHAFCLYDEVIKRVPGAPEVAEHESHLAELLGRLDLDRSPGHT